MLSPANYFQFEQEGEKWDGTEAVPCEFLSSRLIGLPRNSPRHGDAALPSGFGQGGLGVEICGPAKNKSVECLPFFANEHRI
jgi:hypothetical protein